VKTLVRMSAATIAALGLLVAPASAAIAHDNGGGSSQGEDRPRAGVLESLNEQQRVDVMNARTAYRDAVKGARTAYKAAVAPIKDAVMSQVAGQAEAVKTAKAALRTAYQGTDDAARATARSNLKAAVDALRAAVKTAIEANRGALDTARAAYKAARDAARAAYLSALVGIFGSEDKIPAGLVHGRGIGAVGDFGRGFDRGLKLHAHR
jgi:hypothetical protein